MILGIGSEFMGGGWGDGVGETLCCGGVDSSVSGGASCADPSSASEGDPATSGTTKTGAESTAR